jgi:hypothetical protein
MKDLFPRNYMIQCCSTGGVLRWKLICNGKRSRPDRSKVLCADEGSEGGGIAIENLMKVGGESDKSEGAASRDRLVRVIIESKSDRCVEVEVVVRNWW